jgi:hypothetical protein
LAPEFPVRAQRASPREQPAVQARLARHLLRASRLRLKDRPARQRHQRAEARQVPARCQQDRTPRHLRANVRVRARHRLEKSAVGEAGQAKQNHRAADLKSSGAQETDQRKLNLRGVALNFRENLPRKIGNLNPKRLVPVKRPKKEHKRVLTGNKKGAKRILRLPKVAGNSNKAVRSSA